MLARAYHIDKRDRLRYYDIVTVYVVLSSLHIDSIALHSANTAKSIESTVNNRRFLVYASHRSLAAVAEVFARCPICWSMFVIAA